VNLFHEVEPARNVAARGLGADIVMRNDGVVQRQSEVRLMKDLETLSVPTIGRDLRRPLRPSQRLGRVLKPNLMQADLSSSLA
jgi:hypothetical protein